MPETENRPEIETDVSVHCVRCGCELNDQTGRLASPDWYGDTRFVHYCRKCQREQFIEIAYLVSPYLAFFLCCAAYNIPFIPECVPDMGKVFDGFSWDIYVSNIEQADKATRVDGEPASFSDGVTDVQALFGIDKKTKLNEEVTSACLDQGKAGSKRQRREWGESDNWTQKDYDELDRLYAIHSKQYEAGGITPELEFNIRKICELFLIYQKQCNAGEIKEAKDTYNMISKMKADNLMRKRDEAPVAAVKVDHVVAALERKGWAKNGLLLPPDQLLARIRKDHDVYPMGKDIEDQILLAVNNAIRRNLGKSETDILPVEMQITPLQDEFQSPNPQADAALIQSLELPPIKYEKPEGGEAHACGQVLEPDPS